MTDTIQKIADEMTDRASKLRREAGDGDHLLQVIGREVAETVNGWAGRLRALSARASAGEGGEWVRGLTRAVELLRQIHDEHSAPDGVGVHWGTWEALSNYIAEADDNGVAYLNAIDEGPDGEDGPWAEGWEERSRPVADPFAAPQPAQAGAGGGGDSETIDCVRGQYGCGGPYSKTECLGCSQWRAANPKHDEPVGTVHLYPATNGYAESLGVSWNNQWNQIPPIGTKLYTTPASPATGEEGLEQIDGLEFYLHEDPDAEDEIEPVQLVMAMSVGNKVYCHRITQGNNGICRATPPAHGDGEGVLRRLLAIRHSGVDLYTDDGELQDNRVRPHIDFLRDSPEEIERKIHQRGRDAVEAGGYSYFGDVPLTTRPTPEAQEARDAALLAKWIIRHRDDFPSWITVDHACAQCVPDGELLMPGFVCAYHVAERIDAALALPAQGEGNRG